MLSILLSLLFFFNDTAPTEIYTLSLHDALPIWIGGEFPVFDRHAYESYIAVDPRNSNHLAVGFNDLSNRSEEHTSELQSRQYLVCRLLLEKKKKKKTKDKI